jgi:methyl-accepting chemotaxis protein
MTDDSSPVEMIFELQRTTIEQTGDLLEELVKASAEAGDGLTEGVDAQREIQEQLLELTRQSVHQSLDAAETVTDTSSVGDVDDLRETVDTTFDRLLDQQDEAFDAIEESSEQLSDEATERIADQVELLVEFNREIEQQLSETVELLVERAEESDGLTESVEEQFDELVGQVGEQIDAIGDLDEQFETIDVTSPGE